MLFFAHGEALTEVQVENVTNGFLNENDYRIRVYTYSLLRKRYLCAIQEDPTTKEKTLLTKEQYKNVVRKHDKYVLDVAPFTAVESFILKKGVSKNSPAIASTIKNVYGFSDGTFLTEEQSKKVNGTYSYYYIDKNAQLITVYKYGTLHNRYLKDENKNFLTDEQYVKVKRKGNQYFLKEDGNKKEVISCSSDRKPNPKAYSAGQRFDKLSTNQLKLGVLSLTETVSNTATPASDIYPFDRSVSTTYTPPRAYPSPLTTVTQSTFQPIIQQTFNNYYIWNPSGSTPLLEAGLLQKRKKCYDNEENPSLKKIPSSNPYSLFYTPMQDMDSTSCPAKKEATLPSIFGGATYSKR